MARKRAPQPRSLLTRLIDEIRSRQPEFRQDSLGTGFLKKLYMTRRQRLRLLRWGSYILSCLAALLIQDNILSRLPIMGACIDLPAAVILLITVIEGTESGSIFVLLASTLYYFTGSAPGPYVVALMTVFGIGATLFRQAYWHRSRGAILLCACIALMLYEIGTFGGALFMKLTRWDRIGRFLLSGLYGCALMIPLYPLMHKFGSIGGHTWKE
ncbi:MAG: hypothetical protein IJA71_04280 [Clostridia bacterium]|nr:hypothetical protein [Clostridia bacterium]MBQ6891226.1 hypothetical protein [Clostridia bacterium]